MSAMQAFYADHFVLPLPDGHRFPMAKYEMLRDQITAHLPSVRLQQAEPADDAALALVGLDAFGVLCAVYLSHARLRGVRMLRCYPPQRLIPLSLHVLGLLWGVLTLSLQSGGSVR